MFSSDNSLSGILRMKILITGVAGFIDNELALRLTSRGDDVVGIDNEL